MLISPTKKRYDDLQQKLREIRAVSSPYVTDEVVAIQEEIEQLQEQLNIEKSGGPAILKG